MSCKRTCLLFGQTNFFVVVCHFPTLLCLRADCILGSKMLVVLKSKIRPDEKDDASKVETVRWVSDRLNSSLS